jgi:hypothetical protein
VSSSPFPDGSEKVTLTVTAGSTLAEIFLIDHAFRLVNRSVGDLQAQVPPGAYKVKAALGEAATERLIVLRANETIDLGGELEIASPAPFEGTGLTHESHMELATETSAKVADSPGQGATVLIVSRRYSSAEAGADREQAPLEKLSLHGPDGDLIADLAGKSGGDPVVGTTIEVDPGPYRLSWRDHAGVAAEQTVVAVADWQTQVFILEDALGPQESLRNKVSILMSQHGFDPADADLRQVEEARTALADERKVSGKANNALFAKFDNPMLGLFGAHLMLLGQEAKRYAEEAETRSGPPTRPQAPVDFDQALFDEAVGNLSGLLGEEHPDVVALATRVSDVERHRIRPIEVPPMLWRSWLLLIEASNDWPDLVPVHMWRDTARLLPLRPFLVWSEAADGEDSSGAELEMARLMKRTVDEAAGAAATAAADAARRELAGRMLAPRAAVEELIRSVS